MPGPLAGVVGAVKSALKGGDKTEPSAAEASGGRRVRVWVSHRQTPPSAPCASAPPSPRLWELSGADSPADRPVCERAAGCRRGVRCRRRSRFGRPVRTVPAHAHASPAPSQERRVYVFKKGSSAGRKEMKALVSGAPPAGGSGKRIGGALSPQICLQHACMRAYSPAMYPTHLPG